MAYRSIETSFANVQRITIRYAILVLSYTRQVDPFPVKEKDVQSSFIQFSHLDIHHNLVPSESKKNQ